MVWSINTDNGGGGGTAVWDKARGLWAGAGIQDYPWMHVRSMADLQRLVQVGQGKSSPALGVNIEDVVGDRLDLKQVGTYLTANWGKPVHMPTLDWVQNGQGWNYMAFAVAALEFFPGEGNMKAGYNSTVAHQCFEHAQAEGLPKVTAMFKTGGQTPSVYGTDFSLCHSLYTADDITPTAPAWNMWKAPVPCVPFEGENVLTPNEKKEFRAEIVSYTKLAEQYESRWHYTQARPYTGLGKAPQTFHQDDCSSYCALVFYWAAHHTATSVSDPLNYHYSGYGNTQSAYEYLRAHTAPKDKYRIGDMALYGFPANTEHMTVCRVAGTGASSKWSSFGQEAGPLVTTLHYRPDLIGVYRHPALL